MAFTRSLFAASMLLLALAAIASADYGYGTTPSYTYSENPKPESSDYQQPPKKSESDYQKPPKNPESDYQKPPKNPESDYQKPPKNSESDYQKPPKNPESDYQKPPKNPESDYQKPPKKPESDYQQSPKKPESDYQQPPTKPEESSGYDSKVPKSPEVVDELLSTIIGVQGIVLCKSKSITYPIQGAVARIACVGVDDKGYETAPVSVLSHVTDSKGYFLATLPIAELGLGAKVKNTECKAFLESSPLDGCKIPTDINFGMSGARLSSFRILDNKTKLHSVGPFYFASQQPQQPQQPNNPYPVPNGNGY